MRISNFTFHKIYNMFLDEVLKRELTPEQKKSVGDSLEKIWEIKEPGLDGTNFFVRLFDNGSLIGRHTLLRKISENSLKDNSGRISIQKPKTLIKMIEYFGFTIPIEEVYGRDYKIIADILVKEFEKKYPIQDKGLNNKDMAFVISNNDAINDENYKELESSLKAFVYDYLKLLSLRYYGDALDMWNPVYRLGHHNGDYKNFAKEYFNTLSIENINIFNISFSQRLEDTCTADLRVCYEEKFKYRTNNIIKKIFEYNIDQIEDFSQSLGKLIIELKKLELNDLTNLLLHSLLADYTSVEQIIKLAIKPENKNKIDAFLDISENQLNVQVYDFFCVYDFSLKKWQIIHTHKLT